MMESMLVSLLVLLTINSAQSQYSYFNIHRTELAPLPTLRPFALDPLLGTPPANSLAESATQSPPPTSQDNPNSQTVGQTPRFPANNFYFNNFANHHAGRLNPFLFPGLGLPSPASPPATAPAAVTPQVAPTESSTPAPTLQVPQIPNSFYYNSLNPQSLGRLHPFLLPGLGLPTLPTLPVTSTINNTAENTTVVNGTLPQPLPGSFYFNSFAPQNIDPFHPFLLSGLPSMTPARPSAASPSSYLPNFPHDLFDNNYPDPYTNYRQLPQPSTYFRGPHGHYQISGNNRFDYSPFNGFQGPHLPQPVIYQIIYYQLPAGNGTAGNGTTTNGSEVTTEPPTSTASTDVVVEIPTAPSISSRVVEEVTTRAITTTGSPTTTTTTGSPTTTAATTTSTENTTEK